MIRKGKLPDSTTFLYVFKACGQMGLIDEAFRLFTLMIEVYNISHTADIYSSMVEFLSSAGMLREAEHFIENAIPFKPAASVWRTLLSSCQNRGNIRIAKLAAEKLIELEPSKFTTNILLGHVLLQSDKRNIAPGFEFKTSILGSSWIETRGNIIEFASGQVVIEQVSYKLREIGMKMEELGYMTDNCDWLHSSVDHYGKSCHHTELMALAYGLCFLPQGTPIQVFKITPMCGDSHSACKFLSNFLGRDIVIKDSSRFHHFKRGACSCKDKW